VGRARAGNHDEIREGHARGREGLPGTTTVRSDATRSRSEFAVEEVSEARCALIAVIDTQ
jgi:hypothetical protein